MGQKYFIVAYDRDAEPNFKNATIDYHPLAWQRDADITFPGRYRLLNWIPVAKEEAALYEDR